MEVYYRIIAGTKQTVQFQKSAPGVQNMRKHTVENLILILGFHFKPKDVNFFRWSTFPVFFGQLTGAYEGIGTVSHVIRVKLLLILNNSILKG